MRFPSFAWILAGVLLGAAVPVAFAQGTTSAPADSAAKAPPPPPPAASTQKSGPSKIYYGGTVTLSFGSVMRIGAYPMVGYKLTPKLSAGAEVGYEYVDYDAYNQSTSNYGGSVFTRYRLSPQLYAHAEYQGVNYEIPSGLNTTERLWVPFILVGGGLCKPVSPRTTAYVEVLFDVLQDPKSPYEEWDPVISIGVSVGF